MPKGHRKLDFTLNLTVSSGVVALVALIIDKLFQLLGVK